MESIKMNLIYIYDAYCSWCYGFGDVLKRVQEEYKDLLNVEVISGGMVLPDVPQPISVIAEPIASGYKRVEELTGVKYGPDFLWHVLEPEKSDWYPDSLMPSTAVSIIKAMYPERALEFVVDIQLALFNEGRDLTDPEAYRHLLDKYNLDADDFYEKLKSEEFQDAARYDFAMAKQLRAPSFPYLLLQENESKFHLMAKGFADFELLSKRLNNAIAEINS